MATTTLTLPTELMETLDATARRRGMTPAELVRDALAAYVVDTTTTAEPGPHSDEASTPPSWLDSARATGIDTADELTDDGTRFASLGAGESTVDDGYDSTNIKDWIRKTWSPDKHWSTE